MSVYAVFLNNPNVDCWNLMRQHWPGRHFVLDDRLAFVAPVGVSTTAEIAAAVGIGSDGELLGVVFEIGARNGYNRSDLWEWLSKVEA